MGKQGGLGFRSEVLIEDTHTSIDLFKQGWISVYVNFPKVGPQNTMLQRDRVDMYHLRETQMGKMSAYHISLAHILAVLSRCQIQYIFTGFPLTQQTNAVVSIHDMCNSLLLVVDPPASYTRSEDYLI